MASSTAGCSVGSLRVAGLISGTHLSRITGQLDSVSITEAHRAEVSETLLHERQRDKSLLGTTLLGRGYRNANTSPPTSGQRIIPAGHLTQGKELWQELKFCPPTKTKLLG